MKLFKITPRHSDCMHTSLQNRIESLIVYPYLVKTVIQSGLIVPTIFYLTHDINLLYR